MIFDIRFFKKVFKILALNELFLINLNELFLINWQKRKMSQIENGRIKPGFWIRTYNQQGIKKVLHRKFVCK